MNDYIYLGAAPCDEDCAQTLDENYSERARKECRAYINQLNRFLTSKGYTEENTPKGFSLVIKSEAHDFGSYYEVCAKVKDDDEVAYDIAYFLEGESLQFWDKGARAELGIKENEND